MGNKEKQWSAANAALAVSVITTIPTRARISTVLTEQNESSFRRDTETNARAGRATHSRKLPILFRRIDSNEARILSVVLSQALPTLSSSSPDCVRHEIRSGNDSVRRARTLEQERRRQQKESKSYGEEKSSRVAVGNSRGIGRGKGLRNLWRLAQRDYRIDSTAEKNSMDSRATRRNGRICRRRGGASHRTPGCLRRKLRTRQSPFDQWPLWNIFSRNAVTIANWFLTPSRCSASSRSRCRRHWRGAAFQ